MELHIDVVEDRGSTPLDSIKLIYNVMFNCKYCNKEIANKGDLAVHESYCKLNP